MKEVDPDKGKQARSFATVINQTAGRAAPPESSPAPAPPPSAASSADDPADAIRKLAALRDEGLLTDEEFTAKKAQLLGL